MDTLNKWINSCTKTPTWITILVGMALVCWQTVMGQISFPIQVIVFALFLFLTGIPHGALDHLVEKETANRTKKPFNMLFFLLNYVATMLLYAIFWYAFPSASLLFFLLISAWHFGETDIEKVPLTPLWSTTRFLSGNFVLLFILLTHAEETTPILVRISQSNSGVLDTWAFLDTWKTGIIIGCASLSLLFFGVSYRQHPISLNLHRYARWAFVLVLTALLPLLPAFALYFGGWHALSSFDTIQTYLAATEHPTTKSFRMAMATWSKTWLFTGLAIAFFIFGIWYWLRFLQSFDPLPLLFIFLSLITLPHLNVMRKMNNA